MQGSSRPDRELLDVAALTAHLVPEGSVYAFLAEHRLWLFPDEMFADLFATKRGRPSVPADQVATVMVLQGINTYNHRRLHSSLRYKTPVDWENQYRPTQAAPTDRAA
jgi:transposase InsO family protein